MIPAATYRLQLRDGVTLADAEALVPYLDDLGVTDLYLSPVAAARPGSPHGYDIIDPNRVEPDLGGEAALGDLAAALRGRGMGLILDVVPNHMAATYENPWWREVLAEGQDALHAPFFDIDWQPPRQDLAGKILLPVLGDRYGQALSDLHRVEPGTLAYFDRRFPLRGEAENLHALLLGQAYRLAYWRAGLDEVNYRRFFDVADLVGVRVEDADVFAATHAGLLRWAAAGWVTGVRVDHIDGLLDPAAYLRRLAESLPAGTPVWVEKILSPGENLPAGWACAGTTGYEFGAAAGELLYDGGGAAALDLLHGHWGAAPAEYGQVLRQCKREVLNDLFAADVRALVCALAARAARDPEAADLTLAELERALIEVTAWLPVYRTYAGSGGEALDHAAAGAARSLQAADGLALRFVARVLAERATAGSETAAMAATQAPPPRELAARWRQLSGPAMAKGGEDTALYRQVRLSSLNEVGANPGSAGMTVEDFHAWCARRLAAQPAGLSATSTHDSKRSEDVRARIHVLAEVPSLWSRQCVRWRAALGADCAIDPPLEQLLLQAAVGAWPLDAGEMPAFAERLAAYAQKAAREAKQSTSWLDPDLEYEARVQAFVAAILAHSDLQPVQSAVAYYGAVNSLAQVVLKAACPGVPDLYQGCEAWNLSLVDPDSRRPVDFLSLRQALAALDAAAPDPAALFREWADGRVKLWVTSRSLRFRRRRRRLFAQGAYIPVRVAGNKARHVCAFMRRDTEGAALAVVPRFPARLTGADRTEEIRPPLGAVWADTRLVMPPDAPATWTDVLTGVTVRAERVADLLADLPVAMLQA